MQFLVANQESTATIYGHTYQLKPVYDPCAGLQDILVADNGSATELLKQHKETLAPATFEKYKLPGFPNLLEDLRQVPRGSRILILRSGGIGDHIMLIPALKLLKEISVEIGAEIYLATQKNMFPIFEGNTFIDRLLPLPITMVDLLKMDFYVDFSGSFGNADFNLKHPTDFYLDSLGLRTGKILAKLPSMNNKSESSPIIKHLKVLKKEHSGRPLILIQWHASAHIRTFPPEKLASLTHRFKEFTFVIAHHYKQAEETSLAIKDASLNAINISFQLKDLPEFISAVGFSDGVISTDSSGYHVAAALGKPALALFGAIGSHLRTCYYPNVIALDADYHGKSCTSPCDRHKGICPEIKLLSTPYSPCLMSISEISLHESFQKMVNDYLR